MNEYLWMTWAESVLGVSVTLFTEDDPKPGTPLAEHLKDIAAKLKEIEAERLRDLQAKTLPDTGEN